MPLLHLLTILRLIKGGGLGHVHRFAVAGEKTYTPLHPLHMQRPPVMACPDLRQPRARRTILFSAESQHSFDIMKVIAVFNVKGGVGKSTLAANLAWASAHGATGRTLLWDLDPQGGGGFLLGIDRPADADAVSIFARDVAPEDRIAHTRFDRLDVLPADNSLHRLDHFFEGLGKKRRLARLTQSLEQHYDRIVLDCPPALNTLSGQIIRAADAIVVPLTASPLARRGLQDVLDELRHNHPSHAPVLPVFAMYDARRKLHYEAKAAEPDWPIIPMASVVERMGVFRQPVAVYAASSPAALAYQALWVGIERKLVSQVRKTGKDGADGKKLCTIPARK